MLIRKNDKLATLPHEDRTKLDSWLRAEPYRRVLELAAAPRPEGLALKTNLRALSHYFNKFIAPDPLEQLNDLALHNPKAAESAASTILLQQAVMAAAATADFKPLNFRTLNSLMRFHFRLQRKTHDEKNLELKKQQLALRALQK